MSNTNSIEDMIAAEALEKYPRKITTSLMKMADLVIYERRAYTAGRLKGIEREKELEEGFRKIKENLSGWEDTDTMMGIAIKHINQLLPTPPNKDK